MGGILQGDELNTHSSFSPRGRGQIAPRPPDSSLLRVGAGDSPASAGPDPIDATWSSPVLLKETGL